MNMFFDLPIAPVSLLETFYKVFILVHGSNIVKNIQVESWLKDLIESF